MPWLASSRAIALALLLCACCCADEPAPPGPYLDLDALLDGMTLETAGITARREADDWTIQILPSGVVYPNYLASTKESRLSTQVVYARSDGWLFNNTLGGRVGALRWGTRDPYLPTGLQIDIEGSAQVRLDIPEDVEVRSTDYRGGVPITFGVGPHRWKVGYYHLSSHVGDEFLVRNPTFTRLNYVRDAFVIGYTRYVTNELRCYGEASWAFYSEVGEPWELLFGIDYAPALPTGIGGAPFFALNGHLREEVNFGGSLTAQIGWAWRGDGGLLRIGGHYFNGDSNQFSFFDEHEQMFGLGAWYDH